MERASDEGEFKKILEEWTAEDVDEMELPAAGPRAQHYVIARKNDHRWKAYYRPSIGLSYYNDMPIVGKWKAYRVSGKGISPKKTILLQKYSCKLYDYSEISRNFAPELE